MAGRKTKLTDEVQAEICGYLAGLAYRCIAVRAAGVGISTFNAWMRRGKKQPKSRYGAFRAAILEAENRAEIRLGVLAAQHAATDPKSVQWALTHRFPKRWADPKSKLEVSGQLDVEATVGVIILPPESEP
jgi:hypothetical protein